MKMYIRLTTFLVVLAVAPSVLHACVIDDYSKHGQECSCSTKCLENSYCLTNETGGLSCQCLPCQVYDLDYKQCVDKTQDVDECADTQNPPCQQNCTNTLGSFLCSCFPGYVVDPADGTKCQDIDECQDGSSTCQQICTNTPGGYSCSCRDGFVTDPHDPSKCVDVDECREGSAGCDHVCTNTQGSYKCSCRPGYVVSSTDKHRCEDIDECRVGTAGCEHTCTNTPGSYQCSCRPGYVVGSTDRKRCEDVDECRERRDLCEHTCTNTPGSYQCSCLPGFVVSSTDRHRCEDIDECQKGTDGCEHTCTNTPGSYQCSCRPGYVVSSTDRHRCDDVDECRERRDLCEHTCTNTPGSYKCSCRPGYVVSSTDKHKCVDVDECREGTAGCEHTCTNTQGSYQCSCRPGYVVSSTDRRKCEDVDECQDGTDDCEQTCTNTPGSYQCSCRPGFVASSTDDSKCEDVNECDRDPCYQNQICTNTIGSYLCTCKPGYVVNASDLTRCQVKPCSEHNVLDLVFLVDASGSIGETYFPRNFEFIRNILPAFTLSENSTKVGLLTFGTSVRFIFNLTGDLVVVLKKLENVAFQGSTTSTHAGLLAAFNLLTLDGFGGRSGANKSIVLISDGRSTNRSKTLETADYIKDRGVNIFTLGIKPGADQSELIAVASRPEYFLSVLDYVRLVSFDANVTDLICHAVPPPPAIKPCPVPIVVDIHFVIDSSGSIGIDNYKYNFYFISRLLRKYYVAEDGTKISLITYGTSVREIFKLSSDSDFINEKLENVTYQNSTTSTHAALNYVRNNLSSPEAGARPGTATKVILLITDGRSSKPSDTLVAAAAAKAAGFTIVVLGVTNSIDRSEVLAIASKPEYAFFVYDYDILDYFASEASDIFCQEAQMQHKQRLQNH